MPAIKEWGLPLLARFVFAAALIDLAVLAAWASLGGPHAGDGCSATSTQLLRMGHSIFIGSLWLALAALLVRYADRRRGNWSLVCALAVIAVFLLCPRYVC